MEKVFGYIYDYSAVENIEQEEEDLSEEFNSRYTPEEVAALIAERERMIAETEFANPTQQAMTESARKTEELFHALAIEAFRSRP